MCDRKRVIELDSEVFVTTSPGLFTCVIGVSLLFTVCNSDVFCVTVVPVPTGEPSQPGNDSVCIFIVDLMFEALFICLKSDVCLSAVR